MARTDQQGFEGRSLNLLDGYAAISDAIVEICAESAYDDIGYGLHLESGDIGGALAWVRFMFPDSAQADQAYIRIMMQIDLNGNTDRWGTYLDILDDYTNTIIRIHLASGEFTLPLEDSPLVYYDLTPATVTADWTRWEFYVKVAEDGMILIRQDDDDKKVIYANTEDHPGAKLGGIYWWVDAEVGIRYYIDDLAYNDTVDDGRGNDTFPGAGKVIRRASTDVGSNEDFTPFPGVGESNWANVDDGVPDDDTTYAASGSADDIDTHITENIPDGYMVREGCVKMMLRAKLSSPGPGEIATYVVDGGDSVEGVSVAPNVYSYRNYHEMIPTSPDGSEWTKELVDSAEFGYKSSA